MKEEEQTYKIANFPIGINKFYDGVFYNTSKKPLATCFLVCDTSQYHLMKLFSSYALFTPNSSDHVRKGLSLIAHIETDATLFHGGLTQANNKNILIFGPRASGKSTLTNNLGTPLEDDTLVYRDNLLYIPSVKGYVAIGRSPDKKMEVVSTNQKPLKPDFCLLLEKSKEGGYIEKTNEIPQKYYIPDYFNKENIDLYKKYDNFKKPENLETYIIGTNGNLEKTIDEINSKIIYK